ncbi:MAG: hypothetical protein ABSB40_01870 [Nitrososphaeria archaeon]|jgi:hypothetical protein
MSETQKVPEPQNVSRRKFLYYGIGGAIVIVAVGAGAYYLTRSTSTTTGTTGTTIPTSAATNISPTTTASYPAPAEDSIYFDMWPYRPDLVGANVAQYDSEFNDVVNYAVLAGDWTSQIQDKLIAGSKDLDCAYVGTANANTWYNAGWIRGLDDLQVETVAGVDVAYSIDDIKNDLTAPAWDCLLAGSTKKPCYLPYFESAFGNIVTNEKLLEAGGYADTTAKTSTYPKSYEELYAQCQDMQKKGVADSPLLKRWGNESWEMAMVAQIESQARGDPVFDSNGDPSFDVNTPYGDMLKDWQMIYSTKLCPQGVLNMTEGDNITEFETGLHAYSEQHTYDLFTFQDPAQSKVAPNCSIVPPLTTNSPIGYLLVNGFFISNIKESDQRLARKKRFAEFYTYKDSTTGTFYRPKNFMTSTGVGSPYPKVMSDPDVISFVTAHVYRPQDATSMGQLLATAWMPEYLKYSWNSEWVTDQQTILQQCVQGTMTVTDAINAMRTDAQNLKKKYGGNY